MNELLDPQEIGEIELEGYVVAADPCREALSDKGVISIDMRPGKYKVFSSKLGRDSQALYIINTHFFDEDADFLEDNLPDYIQGIVGIDTGMAMLVDFYEFRRVNESYPEHKEFFDVIGADLPHVEVDAVDDFYNAAILNSGDDGEAEFFTKSNADGCNYAAMLVFGTLPLEEV